MKPKEKAKELVENFRDDPFTSQITTKGAKRCALIAVGEVLAEFKLVTDEQFYETRINEEKFNKRYRYWHKVKKEIGGV